MKAGIDRQRDALIKRITRRAEVLDSLARGAQVDPREAVDALGWRAGFNLMMLRVMGGNNYEKGARLSALRSDAGCYNLAVKELEARTGEVFTDKDPFLSQMSPTREVDVAVKADSCGGPRTFNDELLRPKGAILPPTSHWKPEVSRVRRGGGSDKS